MISVPDPCSGSGTEATW